jgi:hypothetical protein
LANNVQPKSSILIGAKVGNQPPTAFTLVGDKAEIEKKKSFQSAPRPKKGYHHITIIVIPEQQINKLVKIEP